MYPTQPKYPDFKESDDQFTYAAGAGYPKENFSREYYHQTGSKFLPLRNSRSKRSRIGKGFLK